MNKEMRDVSRYLNDLMLSAAGKDETAYSYLEALWEEICKAENRYKCERCKHWNDGCDRVLEVFISGDDCARRRNDYFEPRWEDGDE